ncbi:MAG: histidine kinase, partial [Treponema socranskii subsp. buccale]
VFARNVYTLKKFHNPIPDEELVFDFSTCKGTIEEAVIALVSVEKVFRMYKSPDVTAADVVRVDKKIDEFLEKHFNRYNYYCGVRQESAEGTNYFEYAYLREDEQLDDLTLLAVLRP